MKGVGAAVRDGAVVVKQTAHIVDFVLEESEGEGTGLVDTYV